MSPQTTERLGQLAISPTGFVFDPRSGVTYTINATGRSVIEALRDGADLDELVERLNDSFETDGDDLRRDALEYVRLLREHGLLPVDFELD
jgi:PqqD family protein of HPr-rel-A system